ncbi:MAG: hypothetical protein M1835_001926 [Candelina submexicana]|nr:MAG: hypothetical protein M1835_001926 [Candelina submexicana]
MPKAAVVMIEQFALVGMSFINSHTQAGYNWTPKLVDCRVSRTPVARTRFRRDKEATTEARKQSAVSLTLDLMEAKISIADFRVTKSRVQPTGESPESGIRRPRQTILTRLVPDSSAFVLKLKLEATSSDTGSESG